MLKISKLGDVCKIRSGNSIPAKEKDDLYRNVNEGLPYVATKDIGIDGSINFENGVTIPSKFNSKFRLSEKDSVLICAEGGSAGKKIAYSNQDCYFVNKLFSIKPKNEIDANFIYYYTLSDIFQNQFKESLHGLIGGVSLSKIKNFQITYPPLSEQQHIVARLDAAFAEIDKAKETTATNIINANLFFKNYLMKVFENENKDWDKNNLKELTTKIGSGSTPRGGNKSYKNSGTSLIRSMNVHDKGFVYNKLAFIDDTQAKKLNIVNIEKDDVIINITGASVARCCIVPNDVLPARVNQHVSILRTKKNILNPKLLHFILTSPYHKNKLLKIGEEGGATRQAITKNQLEEYVIRFPKNYNLQSELVKKIIDAQILALKIKSIYENKLKNFIQLKQSILNQKLQNQAI